YRVVSEPSIIDTTDNGCESDADGAVGYTNPATLDSSSASGGRSERTPTGRIKRKYGSRKPRGTASRETSKTTDSINSILFSGHQMLASLLSMPRLRITKEDSAKLTDAIIKVTEFYDMSIGTEEQRAWFNLAMVAGGVYLPIVFGKDEPQCLQAVERQQPISNEPTPMPAFMVNGSGKQVQQ
ncbi:MAG: hypothetical protein ACREOZ_00140, partial [Gloeomargaritales cyanobacterium]